MSYNPAQGPRLLCGGEIGGSQGLARQRGDI